MRVTHGDDYAIACCVSPMKIGKQMQFFGARANLAKALLYAINDGIDELHPDYKLGPNMGSLERNVPLNYDVVFMRFKTVLHWLAKLYINALNIIHYMHDKYNYESAQMALYDLEVYRYFATGIAGLSVVADSLSAIKYAKVTPVWTKTQKGYIATDFNIEGDFPKYGNDDDRVDQIAVDVIRIFNEELKKNYAYKNSGITMSVLTITSNVVYGKNTGSTPDGRKAGEPFAPGANPMHGRDNHGAVASLASVSKIPFKYAADGISNTFSIVPSALGSSDDLSIVLDHGCCVDFEKCKK